MRAKYRDIDWWLVSGASFYWASVGMRYLSQPGDIVTTFGPVGSTGRYVALFVLLVLGYAVLRVAGFARGRRILGVVVLCSATLLGIDGVGMFEMPLVVGLPAVVLDSATVAAFMIPWGAAFASMDKRRAGCNVIVTILLSVVLMLLGLSALAVPLSLSCLICVAVSALIMVFGRIPFSNRRRERVAGVQVAKAVALLQRIAFGLFLGFSAGIAQQIGIGSVSGVLFAFGFAMALFALGSYLYAPERLYAGLPALLLVAVGAVCLPFLENGISAILGAAAAMAWLAWQSLSSVQLSDLKERFGYEELGLCCIDKVAFAISLIVGSALFNAVGYARVTRVWGSWEDYALLGALGALVLGSAYVMACLVGVNKENEMLDELEKTRRERAAAVYGALAEEFRLSAREREVMEMLADGYTGPYIKDALGISDGTVKAHAAHIYQKLGVHKKDELLDLIKRRME